MLKRNIFLISILFAAFVFAECTYKTSVPIEFPTPPPDSPATPAPKLALKPDTELEKQIAKIAEQAKGKGRRRSGRA